MSSSASFGVSGKLFGDRNLPSYCSSLAGESDPRGYIAFSATEDDWEIDAIKFDDTECISVNRTPGMRGRSQNIITVATDLIGPESDEDAEDSMAIEPISFREEFSLKQQNVHATTVELSPRNATASPEFEFEEVDLSEHLNIHFAVLTPRQKRCSDEIVCDDEDDNMSIITDISMIPTYCPSDVMQHEQRSRAVTLLGRLFKAKASAAKKTVRQFKRSCRGVMENTFAEPNTYRPTKCVRVGEAF
ncbi:hypothetical protein QBC42DRAFT_189733 [Cladorrhinum samala]|uniref:Uncharacterized protein n=1 Tax=Cladorrhinum samala TaxID=585594 RepID=A0AAV9H7D5_9PEZI|nr:hypothetical protein QBC42DRAFT_189733 [Cladorrhinum samala]